MGPMQQVSLYGSWPQLSYLPPGGRGPEIEAQSVALGRR